MKCTDIENYRNLKLLLGIWMKNASHAEIISPNVYFTVFDI
jgi:hypothetical protein